MRRGPVRFWRHYAGGFVLSIAGTAWLLEISYARRRRDRYGRGRPFEASLTTWPKEEA